MDTNITKSEGTVVNTELFEKIKKQTLKLVLRTTGLFLEGLGKMFSEIEP